LLATSALNLVDIGQSGFEGNKIARRKGEASSVILPTNHRTFLETSVQWKSFDFLRVALQICGTDLPAEKKKYDPTFCLHLVKTGAEAFRIIRRRLLISQWHEMIYEEYESARHEPRN
jgi:hypothetical protein